MSTRGIYIIVAFLTAIAVAYFWGGFLENSDNAMSALIDVFAILAGVLVAVISIVGDPSMLLPGNWRVAHVHAEEMQNKIANFSHLFFVYIISLLLLVLSMVMKDNGMSGPSFVYNLTAFFSTFGVLLSIPLPYSLMALQKERMREEVKARRSRSGSSACD
ncbi:cytochrome bd-type quinol oxidase subunit 2 [Agrobacterium tumefaciens]|uniref:hypothetical protein n=1 Tax=Agrobacterium tumefaciens TaxID=358 RepID=UPI001AE45831|nr:hypothetical protein [Agrobacterium tumefaciens]MBP2538148.1 cytochrome bd-type quinol oxidase subunit 2 [Agrobacterium tumefaciens]